MCWQTGRTVAAAAATAATAAVEECRLMNSMIYIYISFVPEAEAALRCGVFFLLFFFFPLQVLTYAKHPS